MIGVLGDDEPTLVDARRLLIHLVGQHNLRPPRVVPPAPRVPLGPTRKVQLPVGIVTAAPLQDNQSVHLSYAVLISQLDGEAHVVALLVLWHLLLFGHPWCSLLCYSACSPRLNLRPSCSAPPPQAIQSVCHSREPQRSMPRLEAGRSRGTRIPCEVPGVQRSTRRVAEAGRIDYTHPWARHRQEEGS